jgi:dethiobiotin synthetase
VRFKKPNAVFITGTDTGVGKTIITGLLGRYLLEKKYETITQKWVETGVSDLSQDTDVHLSLLKIERRSVINLLPFINPYLFKLPASPHLAAALENKRISPYKIKHSFGVLAEKFDFVIVEGAGGTLVPYSKKRLLIDIAADLNLPVLIVVQNKLGAINHTLLTIETIRRRRLRIAGIIFNNLSKAEDRVILKDNIKTVKRLSGEKVLGNLPFLKNVERLYKTFIPIGDKFLTEFNR